MDEMLGFEDFKRLQNNFSLYFCTFANSKERYRSRPHFVRFMAENKDLERRLTETTMFDIANPERDLSPELMDVYVKELYHAYRIMMSYGCSSSELTQ